MNVIDGLKDKTVAEIRAFCQKNSINASAAMFNVGYDFNIAALVRNSNFFGFRKVFHIQSEGKRIDRRGAVGCQNYTDLHHFYDADSFFNHIAGKYKPVAIENNIDYPCKELMEFAFPKNPCFIFGAENAGLTKEVLDRCPDKIFIKGYGSVPSLNVGVCSGIIMSAFRCYKQLVFDK